MKTRVITAVIALAIFIPLIIVGHLPLTFAAMVLGVVAVSEVLIMKKIFVTSFAAIVSYLAVILMIVPAGYLAFLPSQLNRLTTVIDVIVVAHGLS